MQNQYEQYMEYVERCLTEAGRDEGRRHPFRLRSRHTRRVLKWAERLCEGRTDVDLKVLYTSVIFHDIGYVTDNLKEHPSVGAAMFLDYAREHQMDKELTQKVAECIRIHSEKWRMKTPEDLTIEQLLLMEADMLDEEGALGICWDGLACGITEEKNYQASLARTKLEMQGKIGPNPMVTEKARQIWQKKQDFVKEYVKELEFDLAEASLDGLE